MKDALGEKSRKVILLFEDAAKKRNKLKLRYLWTCLLRKRQIKFIGKRIISSHSLKRKSKNLTSDKSAVGLFHLPELTLLDS